MSINQRIKVCWSVGHPNQHWWGMLDFTVFPTKAGGGDSIHTHCNTFYLILIALIMINLEDLPVKKDIEVLVLFREN